LNPGAVAALAAAAGAACAGAQAGNKDAPTQAQASQLLQVRPGFGRVMGGEAGGEIDGETDGEVGVGLMRVSVVIGVGRS
jgi:hypothetical protein